MIGASSEPSDAKDTSALSGRRLMMFGPEGFREAPRNHRLVVVMGSSPEKFFSAVDEALGHLDRVPAPLVGEQVPDAPAAVDRPRIGIAMLGLELAPKLVLRGAVASVCLHWG